MLEAGCTWTSLMSWQLGPGKRAQGTQWCSLQDSDLCQPQLGRRVWRARRQHPAGRSSKGSSWKKFTATST